MEPNDPLSSLLSTFLTETQNANSRAPAAWQQELLETIDPVKQKKRNFARALAQASQALATTPGNFLTGLSTAASAGANSYIDGRDRNDLARVAAMREIDQARRGESDDALARMERALGVGLRVDDRNYRTKRDTQQDLIAEEDRDYTRKRNERTDARLDRQAQSLDTYRRERNELAQAKAGIDSAIGAVPGAPLTRNQRRMAIDSINRFATAFEERRLEEIDADYSLSPEEKQVARSRVAQEKSVYKDELYREYGVDRSAPSSPAADQQSILPEQNATPAPAPAQPPASKPAQSFKEGQTATNPTTGARMIFRNGQWQPL